MAKKVATFYYKANSLTYAMNQTNNSSYFYYAALFTDEACTNQHGYHSVTKQKDVSIFAKKK